MIKSRLSRILYRLGLSRILHRNLSEQEFENNSKLYYRLTEYELTMYKELFGVWYCLDIMGRWVRCTPNSDKSELKNY